MRLLYRPLLKTLLKPSIYKTIIAKPQKVLPARAWPTVTSTNPILRLYESNRIARWEGYFSRPLRSRVTPYYDLWNANPVSAPVGCIWICSDNGWYGWNHQRISPCRRKSTYNCWNERDGKGHLATNQRDQQVSKFFGTSSRRWQSVGRISSWIALAWVDVGLFWHSSVVNFVESKRMKLGNQSFRIWIDFVKNVFAESSWNIAPFSSQLATCSLEGRSRKNCSWHYKCFFYCHCSLPFVVLLRPNSKYCYLTTSSGYVHPLKSIDWLYWSNAIVST